MHELDRIDRKILDILQREGRLSMTDLAERVGLSASPCTCLLYTSDAADE